MYQRGPKTQGLDFFFGKLGILTLFKQTSTYMHVVTVSVGSPYYIGARAGLGLATKKRTPSMFSPRIRPLGWEEEEGKKLIEEWGRTAKGASLLFESIKRDTCTTKLARLEKIPLSIGTHCQPFSAYQIANDRISKCPPLFPLDHA